MSELNPQDQRSPLIDLWLAVRKRRTLILWTVLVAVVGTAIYGRTLPDIYEAQTVIAPVSVDRDTAGMQAVLSTSGLSNLANLANLPLPVGGKMSELEQHMKSRIVREKLIVRYNLLPILFSGQWDKEKQTWKGPGSMSRLILFVKGLFAKSEKDDKSTEPAGPSIWDGIRELDAILSIRASAKENVVTIKALNQDPKVAATILTLYLQLLQDHLIEESQRVAKSNEKHLREQLVKAVEPITRQKIYYLLSKQIEIELMAAVKENSTFVVIDPPRAPDRKIGPRRTVNIIVGAMLAFMAGCIAAFYLEKRSLNRQ